MTAILTGETECPYCTSRVIVTTHDDGRLESRHVEPYGPGCEAGLQRLMTDAIRKTGMKPMFRNSN